MQVQDRRSYGEVERPSIYLDKTDIGAGILEGEGRGRVVRGHDFVVANSKGKGAGRPDQGHDINVANSEGEGAGRLEQGHDIDVANSEAEWRGMQSKAMTSSWVRVSRAAGGGQ